jgi:hypothetical protein
MQKWEYKQAFSRPRIEQLNVLGNDGWELVAIHGDTFIFKRPAPGPDVYRTSLSTEDIGKERIDAKTPRPA